MAYNKRKVPLGKHKHQPFGELVLNAPEFIGLFVLPILLYRRLWLLPFSATLYVLRRLA
jgi:hypothetical protein